MKILNLFLICLSFFPLVGCIGTQYDVSVDTMGNMERSKMKYILRPFNKNITTYDLQFKEFSKYVNAALKNKGFKEVSSIDESDIIIFLYFKIGEPKEHYYRESVPTFGQTGVIGSTTTGTISSYGGMSTYTANTTYTPTYGITGYQEYSGTYITYTRYISLEAIDSKEFLRSKKLNPIWKTTMISIGSSRDLRKVFPAMILAGYKYIAQDTKGQKKIEIPADDDYVQTELQKAFGDI